MRQAREERRQVTHACFYRCNAFALQLLLVRVEHGREVAAQQTVSAHDTRTHTHTHTHTKAARMLSINSLQ